MLGNISAGPSPGVSFRSSPRDVDLSFSTIVNTLRFSTTNHPRSRKAMPCKMRLTVRGPASIRDYFIAEPVAGRPTDCLNAQRVTFNGASNLDLGVNETATSDVIEWVPVVGTGIMLSFATDAVTSLAVTLDRRCLSYVKRGTNEAGQLKRSEGYSRIAGTCFALDSFEVVQE
jgi:hypothetical protein